MEENKCFEFNYSIDIINENEVNEDKINEIKILKRDVQLLKITNDDLKEKIDKLQVELSNKAERNEILWEMMKVLVKK